MTISATMKKYHCDRCAYEAILEEDSIRIGAWARASAVSHDDQQVMGSKYTQVDLCPACMESLIQWWLTDNPHARLRNLGRPEEGYTFEVVPDRRE